MSEAVRTRALAAEWLLRDRLPDWQLGIVVVSESHSAIEPLWHGVDPSHPLHSLPSAPAAREALRKVYDAIDKLVGDLVGAFPDATVVAFAMHGMGANDADLPAMALVPELLYRHAFGNPFARPRNWASELASGAPVLAPEEGWDRVMAEVVPWPAQPGIGNALRRLVGKSNKPVWAKSSDLGWMPATRYYAFWPEMPAFALPAYYDSQIRLNVEGREARGTVPLGSYEAARTGIVALFEACRDPATGEPAVASIHLHEKAPFEMGPTEADIYVSFRPGLFALDHPKLGRIGPYPFRRTGGHSGPWGFLWAAGKGIAPGMRGGASSFDVAPTILDWLDQKRPSVLSGESLMPRLRAGALAEPRSSVRV